MERGPSESLPKLPWGPKLSRVERLELAALTGAVDHALTAREFDGPPLSTDPVLWGVLLGQALRRVEQGRMEYTEVVDVALAIGADEQVAATHLAWLQAQPGC